MTPVFANKAHNPGEQITYFPFSLVSPTLFGTKPKNIWVFSPYGVTEGCRKVRGRMPE